MFTGIIQALGTVKSFDGQALLVQCTFTDKDPVNLGESIAVNGCCLTVQSLTHDDLRFQLSEETLNRTALNSLQPGFIVNVERAVKMGDRLGGHWVQGHVDAVGRLENVTANPQSHTLSISVPPESEKYLVDKGSITIDGVSLTVIQPSGSRFQVAVIPHTWHHTNLSRLQPGGKLNLEFDVLAKYVERLSSFK